MSWIGGMFEWLMGTGGSTEASIKPCQDQTKVVPKLNSASIPSNLNPNAKVFTPPLNPNAKEFTPAKRPKDPVDFTTTTVAPDIDIQSVSSSAFPDFIIRAASLSPDTTYDSTATSQCSEPSCDGINSEKISSQNITPTGSATVTPSGSACVTPAPNMETALKSTTARLCTPWVPQDGKTGLQCAETDDETLESDADSDDLCDADSDDLFSEDSDEEEEEDDDDNDVTNTSTCDER